jgi:tetratricopeptide (TPR) repeat protein
MTTDPRDEPQPQAPTAAAGVEVLHQPAVAPTADSQSGAPGTAAAAPDPGLDRWLTRSERSRTVLDRILATLVLMLAVVLGSVPIRNSDAWLHIAAGRHVIASAGSWAPDPFTHTGTETAAEPTWLFDVICYGLFTAVGATGLGITQALSIVLLAGILLFGARRPTSGCAAATATALALLAMAPWLRLQPLLCSLVFLALTIAFLERCTEPVLEDAASSERRSWLSFWPLYLLLVMWANSDAWFLAGLIVLACYWLGGLVQVGRRRRARVPLLVVATAGAVCLLNPRGYQAFTIPADLVLLIRHPSLANDTEFRSQFLTPLHAEFFTAGSSWLGAYAGLALLLFLGAGVALLNHADRRLSRLLVCAAFIALALIQARYIPFLAVALATYVPRAWHEIATGRVTERTAGAPQLLHAIRGRLAIVVTAMIVVVLAWLGRLQPGLPQPRGWGLAADPSLVRAAEQMALWRRDGKVQAPARGFNYTAEIADYCAWFCPDEKGFLNSRVETCIDAASDFAILRQGLAEATQLPADPSRRAARQVDWRAVMRRRQIDHVVLADRNAERMQAVLYTVLARPDEWQVLFQAGRVLVLAWRDPHAKPSAPPSRQGLDLYRDGLDTGDEQKAPAEQAPPSAVLPWWASLVPAADETSLDRDEAALRMMMFEALRGPTARRQALVWEFFLSACATGQVLGGDAPGAAMRMLWLQQSAALPPGSTSQTGQSTVSEQLRAGFLLQRDEAPVGQLLAAIRACRRALASHPHDADAYLLLGQVYCRLAWQTSERIWGKGSAALGELRNLQAVSALQQALRLKPTLDQAEGLLVTLYQRSGSIDRALRHLRAFEEIQRRRGRLGGETAAQFAERIGRLDAEALPIERQVFNRESELERIAVGRSLADRARVAIQLGLADQALQLLEDTEALAAGTDELYVAMQLLLSAGRAPELRALLTPQHKALFGDFEYHWLSARVDLATGDYAGADAHLAKLVVRSTAVPELHMEDVDLEIGLAVAVAKYHLAALRQAAGLPHPPLGVGTFEPQRVQMLARAVEQAAEFAVVHGVMALEAGNRNRAIRLFRQAARLSQHDPQRSVYPIASYYERLLAPGGEAERPMGPGFGDS